MKKAFSNILFFLVIILFISCKKNDNILKVALDPKYPPMEYYKNEKIVGFDVDLINLIASKLNKKIQIIDVPFDTIFSMLKKNQVNLIISSITVTNERKQQVDFSDPYFYDKTVLIVRNDYNEIKTLEDLENKKIGTRLGTIQDDYANSIKNIINYKYEKIDTAIIDLIAEEIDAILVDESIASDLISNNKECKLVNDISFLSSPFAIGVNKDNKELLIQINKILKEIKENGKLDKLKKKWNLL